MACVGLPLRLPSVQVSVLAMDWRELNPSPVLSWILSWGRGWCWLFLQMKQLRSVGGISGWQLVPKEEMLLKHRLTAPPTRCFPLLLHVPSFQAT